MVVKPEVEIKQVKELDLWEVQKYLESILGRAHHYWMHIGEYSYDLPDHGFGAIAIYKVGNIKEDDEDGSIKEFEELFKKEYSLKDGDVIYLRG